MFKATMRKYKNYPLRAIVSDGIFVAGALYFSEKSWNLFAAYLVLAGIYTICEHTMGFDDGFGYEKEA